MIYAWKAVQLVWQGLPSRDERVALVNRGVTLLRHTGTGWSQSALPLLFPYYGARFTSRRMDL